MRTSRPRRTSSANRGDMLCPLWSSIRRSASLIVSPRTCAFRANSRICCRRRLAVGFDSIALSPLVVKAEVRAVISGFMTNSFSAFRRANRLKYIKPDCDTFPRVRFGYPASEVAPFGAFVSYRPLQLTFLLLAPRIRSGFPLLRLTPA